MLNKTHILQGKCQVVNSDGSVAFEEDFQLNLLADEGEESIINVYFREQSNPSKYLALLSAAPGETTTMATMTETQTPGSGGYARQQILNTDWAAPSLDSGDMQSAASQKTFGPCATSAWTVAYVALVTTSTGTGGKFIAAVQLSTTTTVAVGQSFLYTLAAKLQ